MSSNIIYHRHHVIPKHFKSVCPVANITIYLTVEQHALAHKKLYEEYGHIEDKWAWKGLEGLIGKEEICSDISRKLMNNLIKTKLTCKYCRRTISKHNMSRHLYSCTNGKEGTKANPTRKGIKYKKH